jgi:DHA1 family multidrug resistance protein-like MFS transporter
MTGHQRQRSHGVARVLVPLGLATCLSVFGDLTLYAVLATQRDVVGLSQGSVGVMLGVNRLIRIPGNPLAGMLLDRLGRRRPLILGLFLGVLSTVGCALVRGFWPFLASRLAWGIAWTLINVGGLAMVLDVSTQANRGRLSGLYNAWEWMGYTLGPLAGGFLVDAIHFRPALLACAGLAAAGMAVAVAALPETARASGRGARGGLRPALNLRPRLDEAWRRGRDALRASHGLTGVFWLHLITKFASLGVILSTLSLLLERRFGQRIALGSLSLGVASASGTLLGLFSLLTSTVGPLAGHLSDTRTGRWPMIVGSLAAGVAGFGLLSCATSLGTVVLGVALSAVGAGAGLATLAAQVGDLSPPGREGVVMGAYATAGDVGSMAGPFLAFALLSVVDLQWVYLLCALVLLAGILVSLWPRRSPETA